LQFASVSRQKVIEYYLYKTAPLISKAHTLASQQKYKEALALLSSYPESFSGYAQVSEAIKVIYNQYLTQHCEEVMSYARAAYAKRSFEEAADIVSTIDPSCSCFNEAKSLLGSIKQSTDDIYADAKQAELEKIQSEERIALEKQKSEERIALSQQETNRVSKTTGTETSSSKQKTGESSKRNVLWDFAKDVAVSYLTSKFSFL